VGNDSELGKGRDGAGEEEEWSGFAADGGFKFRDS